jgi:dihydrofolate synthase/folylpolyglutamate synthase
LKALGSPEKKLPPIVHVAGTNGKGSLVAYLRAMAEAAGYRVHVYTSPHLVRFNERIRVAGRIIGDGELDEILTECEEANAEQPITFFEITTVAAYLAFARVPADLAIVEVGMGGRYDATNVIQPALSAITPIGYDHTGFLGDKLEGIAGEKAGILKHAVPGVIGRQRALSAEVIEAEAARLAAPLFRMGREWQVTPTAAGFRYESDLLGLDLPAPALAGAHQIDNAATASGRPACRSSRAARWSRRFRRAASCGSTADTTRIAAWRSPAWPATGRKSPRRCRFISCSGC